MMSMKNDEASVAVRQAVANNIRSLRVACGYSQSKFAEMINVNRSYINQIELGKENVSLDILVKIADGLDRSIVDLFSGLDDRPPRKLSQDEQPRQATSQSAIGKPARRKTVHYRFIKFPSAD